MTSTLTVRTSARSTTTVVGTGRWRLREAQAHLSELVRSSRSDGAQTITLRDHELVVVDAKTLRCVQDAATGRSLIDALQQSPHRSIEIEPVRQRMPAREVPL